MAEIVNDFGVQATTLPSDSRQWPLEWRKFANAYAEEYKLYDLTRMNACPSELRYLVAKRIEQYSRIVWRHLSYSSSTRFDRKITALRTGRNKMLKET